MATDRNESANGSSTTAGGAWKSGCKMSLQEFNNNWLIVRVIVRPNSR